ncbi:MAG: hypothetical protein J6A19_16505 [Oscillospiraceae bacterium]|nr:hypothetical protein [Oscillospiraceae bacterium]
MIKTKLFSALLASTMVLAPLTPHAFAAGASFVSETISPRYAIDCTPISRLTISGTKGICTSTLQSGVVKSISAEQTLEKFWGLWVWNEVEDAHWTKTVNAKSLSMSNSKTGLDSGTYRLKTDFTLTTEDGTTETITVYSDEVTI